MFSSRGCRFVVSSDLSFRMALYFVYIKESPEDFKKNYCCILRFSRR